MRLATSAALNKARIGGITPMLLSSSGAEVSADIYRAQRIGELWERITHGQGCFNNCNLEKDKYQDRLGLGLIHRRDLNARGNVHYAMRYLVKNDQQLRLKSVGARCLRKGRQRKVCGVANLPLPGERSSSRR